MRWNISAAVQTGLSGNARTRPASHAKCVMMVIAFGQRRSRALVAADHLTRSAAAAKWRDVLCRVRPRGARGHDGAWPLYVFSIAINAEFGKKEAGCSAE